MEAGIMNLSHAKRFDPQFINGIWYAPLSHGSPSQTMVTDYSVFKKSLQEKFTVFGFKKELGKTKHHKFVRMFRGSF